MHKTILKGTYDHIINSNRARRRIKEERKCIAIDARNKQTEELLIESHWKMPRERRKHISISEIRMLT